MYLFIRECVYECKGHNDDVNSVTWIDTASGLPGQLFATASDDCLAKVYHYASIYISIATNHHIHV
jgi:WD40 repeat protein